MKDNLKVHDTASGTMHIYCKWYNPLQVTYTSSVEVSSDRLLIKLIPFARTEALEETSS